MNANIQENLTIKNDFALFENIKNTRAKQASKTLKSITQRLSTPIVSKSKDTLLVGPYKLWPEDKRANKNVQSISALVFDVDDPRGYTFDDIVALINEYFCIVHTTWSHTLESPRYRIVFFLKEKVSAEEFTLVRDTFLFFNSELASIVDAACSDIARAYYWFSYPPERANEAQCCVLMGDPINPSQFKIPKNRVQGLNLMGAYNQQIEEIIQGGITEGSRNSSLASYVGHLINQGIAWDETYKMVIKWNQSLKPPLPIDEVMRTHNSIWKTHNSKKCKHDIATKDSLSAVAKNFALIPASNLLATSPPKREWVIEGFLPRKIVAALIAAGGTGKSYLAMHIAICIASGIPLFNKYSPRQAAKVVFISGEDDTPELQRRLHKAVSMLSPQEGSLLNQNLHFIDLADSFELFTEKHNNGDIGITEIPGLICDQIIKQIGQDIGLVIVDPISRFRGGEENSALDGTRFVQALQEIRNKLNTCVLTLHHINKTASSDGSQNNARGTSAFLDGVRLAFQLNRLKDSEIKQIYGNQLDLPEILRLQSIKSNYGKPIEPMMLARQDDGTLELFDVIVSTNHQQESILKEISKYSLSKTQFKERFGGIKKSFGLAEKALLKKLEEFTQAGLITYTNRNAITLTEAGKKLIAS